MNKKKKALAQKAIRKMLVVELAPQPTITKIRWPNGNITEVPIFAHSLGNNTYRNWTKKECQLYEEVYGKITNEKRKIRFKLTKRRNK